MHLTRSIDPCLYNVALPVHAQFQTGWATFVAMKDASSQCLFRPQVEVAQEVLRTRDFLIGLEKVTLHPALKEKWKAVSDLNVGIVEVLRLKQPVLVALFIARPLGEATASEKAEVIHSVHAQLKELKAMGGKGGFAEFANWVIPPPQARVQSGECHQGQPTPPTTPAAASKVGFSPVASATSAAHTWKGFTVAGRGTTASRTDGPTGHAGGGVAAGAAAAEAPRFAGCIPSQVRLPRTTPKRFAH